MHYVNSKLRTIVWLGLMTYCFGEKGFADEVPITGGDQGIYLGAQVGNLTLSSQTTLALSQIKSSAFYLRMLMGYQFNKYCALETGYGFQIKNTTNNVATSNIYGFSKGNADLLGKIIIPLVYGIQFNLAAGVSLLNDYISNDNTSIRPKFGGAFAYKFTPNWQLDIGMMRIVRDAGYPKSNIYTLGFSYHFVDEYCGQFLC